MHTTYSVYREPRGAARHTFYRRPKKVGQVTILDEGQKFAAGQWVFETYLQPGNQQFSSYRLEWRSERSLTSDWRPDDGQVKRGREWSVVVTFANGRNTHETRFLVWRDRS